MNSLQGGLSVVNLRRVPHSFRIGRPWSTRLHTRGIRAPAVAVSLRLGVQQSWREMIVVVEKQHTLPASSRARFMQRNLRCFGDQPAFPVDPSLVGRFRCCARDRRSDQDRASSGVDPDSRLRWNRSTTDSRP